MDTTRMPAHRRRSQSPMRAGRRSRYTRPSEVCVLPEQFFNSRVRLTTVCPETALMYAVLEDAFVCFYKQFDLPTLDDQRRAQEAEDWFFSKDSRWLFSFVSICDSLELEPEYLRKRLKHWSEAHLDKARREI